MGHNCRMEFPAQLADNSQKYRKRRQNVPAWNLCISIACIWTDRKNSIRMNICYCCSHIKGIICIHMCIAHYHIHLQQNQSQCQDHRNRKTDFSFFQPSHICIYCILFQQTPHPPPYHYDPQASIAYGQDMKRQPKPDHQQGKNLHNCK